MRGAECEDLAKMREHKGDGWDWMRLTKIPYPGLTSPEQDAMCLPSTEIATDQTKPLND